MRGIEKIEQANPQLAATIRNQGGFITAQDLPGVVQADRLILVLVRCGNGRFMCPAQDVKHFMDIIAEHSKLKAKAEKKPEVACGDYVRDVSLPA